MVTLSGGPPAPVPHLEVRMLTNSEIAESAMKEMFDWKLLFLLSPTFDNQKQFQN